MFDSVPIEQFHQFISTPSSRISSISSSLTQTLPISTSTNLNFLSFDPLFFPPTHHNQAIFQSQHLLQTPTRQIYDAELLGKVDQEINLDTRSDDPWSNDEVIQLLRIKSTTENWFQDFTWEHVSRKLAEVGYKRSAEKCKEKYEEETCRSFSSTLGYNKNSSRYLITEELDEDHLYHANQTNHHHAAIEPPEKVNHQCNAEEERGGSGSGSGGGGGGGGGGGENEVQGQNGHFDNDPKEGMVQPNQDSVQVVSEVMMKNKKRKREHKKFEMVKGLCVEIVNKMMAQQEEMHKKVLENMANRDEEKIAREEAWRNEETERVKREIEFREHEQVMAKERQTTINEFINRFNSFGQKIQLPFDVNIDELQNGVTKIDNPIPFIPSEIPKIPFSAEKATGNPNQDTKIDDKPMPFTEIPKIPFSEKTTGNPNQDGMIAKDSIGKRWPRDEVLALIHMRCNEFNGIGGHKEENEGHISNSNNGGGGGGGGGGSLWERISQGMLELGYKRSAKRCKEKWENINKYFRKTKDANKKRSLDSRTCPYYHQLSTLYNQGKLVSSSKSGERSSDKPEK